MAIDFNFEDVISLVAKVVMFIFAMMFIANLFYPLGTAFNGWMGSNALNCPGYVDTVNNGLFSYNQSLDNGLTALTASMTCPILKISPAFIIFIILLSLIAWLFAKKYTGADQPQQTY